MQTFNHWAIREVPPFYIFTEYLSTIIRHCTDVSAFKTTKMVPYVLILSLALVTESLKTLKLLFKSFVHFPDVVTEVYWSILYTFLDVYISSFIHLVPPKQKFWFYQFCDFFFTITVYNWYFYACWMKVSLEIIPTCGITECTEICQNAYRKTLLAELFVYKVKIEYGQIICINSRQI